jgi:hypothetical protein
MPSPVKPADPSKFQEIPSTFPNKTIYVEEFFMISISRCWKLIIT